MKRLSLFLSSALCSLTMAHAAHAGTFHNGWNYSIDAFTDGSGGNAYEIKGLATKETEDHIYVSVSGGSLLAGTDYHGAADGNIGWGDLLFNFTGDSINAANGSLFGVRFAGSNDAGVSQVGVFKDVTAQAVALDNSGYKHLKQYYRYGWEREDTMGDLATKQEAYGYMGKKSPLLNSIEDGTFVGDIDFLSQQQAVEEGIDFDHFDADGDHTHTFRFDRGLIPGGEFIATLLMECANDGIALLGSFNEQESQDVPEPSAAISLLATAAFAYRKLRRSAQ
ncbi:MAG: XDD3 family exosortase-dependent surface protein [Cyanobacteria bacterium P01_D01_bin.156]